MSEIPIKIVCFVGLLSRAVSVFAGETVVVTGLNGHKTTGILRSWTADTLNIEDTATREFPRQDVRSIVFDRPVKTLTGGQPLIWLSNGDRISARAVGVSNDALSIAWPVFGLTRLPAIPLEQTVALIFELPMTASERLRLFADLETVPPGSDLVMLTNGDRSTGEFQKLDAAFVELKTASKSLKIDRSRVRSIRFNPELTNTTRSTGRRAVVTLTDGSRITASSVEVADNALKLKSTRLGNLELPLNAISACQFLGEQVIPLADYEPAKIEFVPFLSATWTCIRNANVLRGPLTLRGSEFVTGLGMHSRMSVTYDLRGNERAFQSIVGIDDVAKGAGSAVFSIEVDGRLVWTSPELTGRSAPLNVGDIDLRGSKRLTLIVDFGQFADVSDYADWCDAALILDPSDP